MTTRSDCWRAPGLFIRQLALLFAWLWLVFVPVLAGAMSECPPAEPLVAAAASDIRHGRGLLWKLTPDRGGAPSWLFGTIHVSDERVVELPPAVTSAIDGAASFVMEALFDEQAVAEFSARMYDAAGAPLPQLIGPELFARARDLLATYGIAGPTVDAMRPWAAFITLSQPAGDAGIPLDLVLMQRAMKRGARLYGLETLAEQADIFDSMPLADQLRLLRETVCQYATVQQEIDRLKGLYLERDLGGIKALSESYAQGDDGLTRRLMDELIVKRNLRMARRVLPRLVEGNAFVAIGALHLPGDDGVLALIERQGYRVEVVY